MKYIPPYKAIDRLDTRTIKKTTLPRGFAKDYLEVLRMGARLQEPLQSLKNDYKKARSEENGLLNQRKRVSTRHL